LPGVKFTPMRADAGTYSAARPDGMDSRALPEFFQ
jgi:hypothetical protein